MNAFEDSLKTSSKNVSMCCTHDENTGFHICLDHKCNNKFQSGGFKPRGSEDPVYEAKGCFHCHTMTNSYYSCAFAY